MLIFAHACLVQARREAEMAIKDIEQLVNALSADTGKKAGGAQKCNANFNKFDCATGSATYLQKSAATSSTTPAAAQTWAPSSAAYGSDGALPQTHHGSAEVRPGAQQAAASGAANELCPYGTKCAWPMCPRQHPPTSSSTNRKSATGMPPRRRCGKGPKPCRYGTNCTSPNCRFKHPAQ